MSAICIKVIKVYKLEQRSQPARAPFYLMESCQASASSREHQRCPLRNSQCCTTHLCLQPQRVNRQTMKNNYQLIKLFLELTEKYHISSISFIFMNVNMTENDLSLASKICIFLCFLSSKVGN